MRFAHPEVLWLLLGLPLLVFVSWISTARKRRALRRFAGGADTLGRFTAEINPHRRVAKALLLQLALLATLFAVARPQWGKLVDEVRQAGVDVVVLMDTSLSMAAEDLAPSRLELARDEIDTLLDSLAGDRVALITFAGLPSLACPLTVDHGAVRLFLDAVEPEVVQVPGTALAEAIRLGIQSFGESDIETVERSRALVLFTDGEDHEGGIEEVLPELKRAGVVVHTIGVGTTRGAPIPIEDQTEGSGRFKKDAQGRLVTTRLDEAVLQQLAFETGGHYYAATAGAREVDELIQTIGAMAVSEFGATLRTRYRERYQIPLGIALGALIAEALLGDPPAQTGDPMIAVLLSVLLAASSVTLPLGGTAYKKTQEGNRHYIDGLYEDALRAYTEAQVELPEAPQLFYDIGNVLYRQGDYEGAGEAYTRALLSSPPELEPDAAYNLGNARFQSQDFGAARDAYTRALRSDPADVDAKRNLELALRALQQQQQQQQDNPNDDSDDQDEQQQQQQQQQQQEGDQQQDPEEGDDQQEQQQQSQDGQPPQEQPESAGESQPADGEMTEEQAKRLLDSAAEDEKESLQRRMRANRRSTRQREKDW